MQKLGILRDTGWDFCSWNWEYLAAGHDNSVAATKIENKCHSFLRYNVARTAELSCHKVSKHRSENDSVVYNLNGKNCGVSPNTHTHTHTYRSALGLCTIWLFNFYKSSSARQERTRPVAILSTTPQPFFRFHLNATCAVCVRTHKGEEWRKKKGAGIKFRAFCMSAYLQMLLKSYRQYLSHFWRVSLPEESARKERGRGQQEDKGGVLLCVP